MINLYDEVIINFDESCTKQAAVAKMLGWMRGHRRLKYVELNKFRTGVEAKYLPYINQSMFPLEDQLAALRQVAWHELIDVGDAMVAAKESGDDVAHKNLELECSEKSDALEQCDRDIESAVDYLQAINQEIFKGAESALINDEPATKKSGEPHINIASLDLWARGRYGICISDVEPNLSENIISTAKQKNVKAKEKSQRDNALSLVLNDILRINPTAKTAKVLAELRPLIGGKNSIIIDVFDEGVKWLNEDKNLQITSKDALGERIRYWKKHRLNQD